MTQNVTQEQSEEHERTNVYVGDLKAQLQRDLQQHLNVVCVWDAERRPPQEGNLLSRRMPKAFHIHTRRWSLGTTGESGS